MCNKDMGVSKNSGTPKWMGFFFMENPIKTGMIWRNTPIFGNIHIKMWDGMGWDGMGWDESQSILFQFNNTFLSPALYTLYKFRAPTSNSPSFFY